MEIYKILKFITVWTLMTTGVLFLSILMFSGYFNGNYVCIKWELLLCVVIGTNLILNIVLVVKR
jgi:hypothetical protein